MTVLADIYALRPKCTIEFFALIVLWARVAAMPIRFIDGYPEYAVMCDLRDGYIPTHHTRKQLCVCNSEHCILQRAVITGNEQVYRHIIEVRPSFIHWGIFMDTVAVARKLGCPQYRISKFVSYISSLPLHENSMDQIKYDFGVRRIVKMTLNDYMMYVGHTYEMWAPVINHLVHQRERLLVRVISAFAAMYSRSVADSRKIEELASSQIVQITTIPWFVILILYTYIQLLYVRVMVGWTR